MRPRGGPESPGPGEVHLWNTVTGPQFCRGEDHDQQGQVWPRWGPESPNPGEAQVGTTVTRCRVVSGADQNHQVQVWCRWQPNSPGPGKALVGYMRSHEVHEKLETHGIPGWRSGLVPAFGPGRYMETRDRIPRRAPGAWNLLLPLPVSLPLSLSL